MILLEFISFVCMLIETADFQSNFNCQKKKIVDLYAPLAKIETINACTIMLHKIIMYE